MKIKNIFNKSIIIHIFTIVILNTNVSIAKDMETPTAENINKIEATKDEPKIKIVTKTETVAKEVIKGKPVINAHDKSPAPTKVVAATEEKIKTIPLKKDIENIKVTSRVKVDTSDKTGNPTKKGSTTKTVIPTKTTTSTSEIEIDKRSTISATTNLSSESTTTSTNAILPKQTIKPVTTIKQRASELSPTVTNTSPEYTSKKSSSSWSENIVNEYKTMHELMGDRIHIGVHSMTFSLDDTSRSPGNHYLGTINELHEVQDSSLANITLGFYPTRNIGIEYRRDIVEARTTTATENNHSDGSFKVDGPIFLGILRLPLDQVASLFCEGWEYDPDNHNITRRIIPYIGLGIAALSGEFNADTWWANGYSSPESWESLGSPEGEIRNGHTREIKVTSEDIGMYFVYGISLRIIDNFYADLSFSKVSVDLTSDFSLDGVYQYTKTIPMSYTSTSIGIRYYF